jgi:hypothetical protein
LGQRRLAEVAMEILALLFLIVVALALLVLVADR